MPQHLRQYTSPKSLLEQGPKPGDLIEIDRKIYSDWALYQGDENVVIISCEDAKMSELKAEVSLLNLEDFAHDSPVRVNNKEVPARTRGLKPLPISVILENVNCCLGKKVHYNYLTKNSEHYVTEWRYGHGWSDQSSVASGALKMLTRTKSTDGNKDAHLAMMSAFQSLLQGCHPQPGTSPKRSTILYSPSASPTMPMSPVSRCHSLPRAKRHGSLPSPGQCFSFPPTDLEQLAASLYTNR